MKTEVAAQEGEKDQMSETEYTKFKQQMTEEEKKRPMKTEEAAQRGETDQMSETEYADSSEDHAATMIDADKVVSYITQIFELSHV